MFGTHPERLLIIAHFQKQGKPGASMGDESIMGSFGGARAFVFHLVRPRTIPQLSARLLSPRLPLFSKVGYVIARSAAKNFGNDVCKCLTSEGLFSWKIFRISQLSFDRNYAEPRQCSQKITETSSDAR